MCKRYCEDCGCGKSNGICINCNEELYIMDYQYPEMDEEIEFSEEFIKKVNEQRNRLNNDKCSH
jgi:hypothetical protein